MATNKHMKCPHCEAVGYITTKQVKTKQGISGGKATAAVMTMGVSMLGTGLSRKQTVTQCKCGRCGMTWHVA
ncbi:MAG: hypothetical protein FWE71_01290 [Nocardioidaceae bacterium]|nr:hypothetical protein [Nocardioidaceae bacterium]MCL2613339.1 hypothetical protein [Nocardioidaceae bacterium]